MADRIRFVIQDARFFPRPAGTFDAVVSWNVFHYLDDPERVLGEMIRMVKAGGKLLLADFSPCGFRLMDAIHEAEGRRHPQPPSRFAHWRARLRAVGFRVGFFRGHHQQVSVYLLPDRDTKFTSGFDAILRTGRIEPIVLPPHSPNLNAQAERWVRSAKEACLSKLILFGEASLRHILCEFVDRFHRERNHQGKDNVIFFPEPADRIGASIGSIKARERIGGLFRFYYREAA